MTEYINMKNNNCMVESKHSMFNDFNNAHSNKPVYVLHNTT